jgi:hypothetical protein
MTFLIATSFCAPLSEFSPRSSQEGVEHFIVIHGRSERLPWVSANGKHDLGYGRVVCKLVFPSPNTAYWEPEEFRPAVILRECYSRSFLMIVIFQVRLVVML